MKCTYDIITNERSYEHRGVKFTCTNEVIIDALSLLKIDLIDYVERQIDDFVDSAKRNNQPIDFKVRVQIERVLKEDNHNLMIVGHNIQIIKTSI